MMSDKSTVIAKEALEEGARHELSAEDADMFVHALETPPAPTERALKTAAEYRRRVTHAD